MRGGRGKARRDATRMGVTPMPWRGRATTLAAALGGALLFWALAWPLPWLLGPLFACLLAALARAPLAGFGAAEPATRTILGVAVGASITPEMGARLDQFALSLALTPALILTAAALGALWFRRFWGFDRATALYGAMPGGLADMLVFGVEAGGDARALALIHATRVLTIATLAPLLMELAYGFDLSGATGANAARVPAPDLAVMTLCAVIGWQGGERIGLSAAALVGPMILAAAASLSGVLDHRPPGAAMALAQLILGAGLGAKYLGVTLAEARRAVLAALGYSALALTAAAAVAAAIVALGLAGAPSALLAFAPGGQAEMAVIAIAADVDVGYVVAHHVARMALVIAGAPLIMRMMR